MTKRGTRGVVSPVDASMQSANGTSVGVKVFTTTLVTERARLGDRVTEWIDGRPSLEITDIVVRQSSDSRFHCLSIIVWYLAPANL